MSKLKVNNQTATALKLERERDKVQAWRDYEAETLARRANMMRLRALRLANDGGDAAATTAPGLAKERTIRSRNPLRKLS